MINPQWDADNYITQGGGGGDPEGATITISPQGSIIS
jgi:hypothetical protein